MRREWQNLRDKKVLDDTTVREWKDVVAEARRRGKEVHMGYLFGICVEKTSDLKPGDPARKCKYRGLFKGTGL